MKRFGHTLKVDYGPSSCNPDEAREPRRVVTCDVIPWLKFDNEWIKLGRQYNHETSVYAEVIHCEDEIELLELIDKLKEYERSKGVYSKG